MTTIQECKEVCDYLCSIEGTSRIIADRTLHSVERVERLYQLGNPWPLSMLEGSEHELTCTATMTGGEGAPEGKTDPVVTLDALSRYCQLSRIGLIFDLAPVTRLLNN